MNNKNMKEKNLHVSIKDINLKNKSKNKFKLVSKKNNKIKII